MSTPRLTSRGSPGELLDGARTVLETAGEPLHVNELTRRLLDRGLWHSEGRTPAATVAARLYMDIKKNGASSRFLQTGKATFSLNPGAPVVEPAPKSPAEPPGPYWRSVLPSRRSRRPTQRP